MFKLNTIHSRIRVHIIVLDRLLWNQCKESRCNIGILHHLDDDFFDHLFLCMRLHWIESENNNHYLRRHSPPGIGIVQHHARHQIWYIVLQKGWWEQNIHNQKRWIVMWIPIQSNICITKRRSRPGNSDVIPRRSTGGDHHPDKPTPVQAILWWSLEAIALFLFVSANIMVYTRRSTFSYQNDHLIKILAFILTYFDKSITLIVWNELVGTVQPDHPATDDTVGIHEPTESFR